MQNSSFHAKSEPGNQLSSSFKSDLKDCSQIAGRDLALTVKNSLREIALTPDSTVVSPV